MQHRIFVQRNTASFDAYGSRGPTDWEDLSTIPGYVWAVIEKTLHEGKMSLVDSGYRAIVPLETDITENDRIDKVEDRAGKELFGQLVIDAVIRRRDHFELRLKGYGAC